MERRTRIWIGLGTALLVGSTAVERVALAREGNSVDVAPSASALAPQAINAQRLHVAQVDAAGEGGPGEGGGQVLGTITEFRLSSTDPNAFAYDASSQVANYSLLVFNEYNLTGLAAEILRTAVTDLIAAPSAETLEAAREAWLHARGAYLRTEAFQFYAGPVDGPGGPLPRLNGWPVDPGVIDTILADEAQSLNFRALARLNRVEAPAKVTTGLHVMEYLLWGADGSLAAEAFADERRGAYLAALAQLLVNDIGVLTAAWAPEVANNYSAAVVAMDQRNALGRAFNGMAVLVGYELPLRRIGAGLFPANENFQPSPFSGTSAEDMRASFDSARNVYFGTGLDALVEAQAGAELAEKIRLGFDRVLAALVDLDAPYERFLAPPAGSAERMTAEAAVRALTDLARDLRQAGNRLGVLVVVPGM